MSLTNRRDELSPFRCSASFDRKTNYTSSVLRHDDSTTKVWPSTECSPGRIRVRIYFPWQCPPHDDVTMFTSMTDDPKAFMMFRKREKRERERWDLQPISTWDIFRQSNSTKKKEEKQWPFFLCWMPKTFPAASWEFAQNFENSIPVDNRIPSSISWTNLVARIVEEFIKRQTFAYDSPTSTIRKWTCELWEDIKLGRQREQTWIWLEPSSWPQLSNLKESVCVCVINEQPIYYQRRVIMEGPTSKYIVQHLLSGSLIKSYD